MIERNKKKKLSLLEALSHGIPSVCSNLKNYKGIFSEKDIGLFNLDDQKHMEDVILNINKKRDHFKKNAKNLFLTHFQHDHMGEAYYILYKKLLCNSENICF